MDYTYETKAAQREAINQTKAAQREAINQLGPALSKCQCTGLLST